VAKVTIKIIKISFTGVLCGVVFGCTTVAETGRSQLLLVSPSQEIQMGLSEFEKQKASTPISKDAAKNSMIQALENVFPLSQSCQMHSGSLYCLIHLMCPMPTACQVAKSVFTVAYTYHSE